MKYVHLCLTYSDFQDASSNLLDTDPFVSYTDDGFDLVTYSPPLSDLQTAANGYNYVDLGLPSGTLWATCNVGANSSTEIGDFFNFGCVEPYTSLELNDYKWYSNGEYTKYNDVDGKLILDLEDDAANYNMGGEWHMPTSKQVIELKNNTTITYSGNNMKFTSNVDSSKYIILPAGNAMGTGSSYLSKRPIIWTSSLGGVNYYYKSIMFHCYNIPPTTETIYRYAACNVRGVLDRGRIFHNKPELAK